MPSQNNANPPLPKLLVVDDQPVCVLALFAAFSVDHKVFAANSGERALALCSSNLPDLILLDVGMDGMDGYAFCSMLKADSLLRDIPVIFVTGHSDTESETKALEVGAVDFITKPINPTIARARVATHLALQDKARRLRAEVNEQKRLSQELQLHRDHLEDMVNQRTQQLVAALQKAEAASQAKTIFLANMSHEIRTPMNAILGFTHMLERSQPTPEQSVHLGKLGGAAQHLLSIIGNIMDISKLEEGALELDSVDFDLAVVLSEMAANLEQIPRQDRVQLKTSLQDIPLWLHGDPARLRQCFFNLAHNAIKFTHTGSVSLRTQLLSEDEKGVLVRFEVTDTGIGVAPELAGRLFKAFEQGDSSNTRVYGGNGLGLAISATLARLMGGDIGVQSEPGNGSTFWFTAKLARGSNPTATPQEVTDESAESRLRRLYKGTKVLVVDDDMFNREIAAETLQDVGFDVDMACDGIEAVEKTKAHEYALIVMDVQMPKMNGLDATRAIRALPGWLSKPILALTANAQIEDRRACEAAGMSDFLTKPINPTVLYQSALKRLR